MKYLFVFLFTFLGLSYTQAQLPKIIQDDLDESYDWLLSVAKSNTCQTATPMSENDIEETRIEECAFVEEFVMFPNPVKDILTVEFKAANNATKLIISSLEGALIKEVKIPEGQMVYANKFDLNDLTPGTYLLSLVQGQKAFIRKLIKQ